MPGIVRWLDVKDECPLKQVLRKGVHDSVLARMFEFAASLSDWTAAALSAYSYDHVNKRVSQDSRPKKRAETSKPADSPVTALLSCDTGTLTRCLILMASVEGGHGVNI